MKKIIVLNFLLTFTFFCNSMEKFDQYSLDQKLIEGCIEGDLDQVKLLFGDANPYVLSENGKYCLLEAALSGQIEVVEWLLDNNINPNIIGEDGYPLISLAVCSGNKKLVKRLLKRGIEFRKHLKKGLYSPLACAEQYPVIKKILEKYINKKEVRSLSELAVLAYLKQNQLEIDKDIDAQKITEPAQEILKEICCKKLWEQFNDDFNSIEIEEASAGLCSSMSVKCFSSDRNYCLVMRGAQGYVYDASEKPYVLISDLELSKDWDYSRGDVLSAAINMEKKIALTGYRDGIVCLWNLSKKQPSYSTLPQIDNQNVTEIILSNDGNIALMQYGRDIMIWNLFQEPEIIKIISNAYILSYTSDLKYISIFEALTKQATLWNVHELKKIKNTKTRIIFSKNNKYGLIAKGTDIEILDFTQGFISNLSTITMDGNISSIKTFSIDNQDFALIYLKDIFSGQFDDILYLLNLDTLELKLLYDNKYTNEMLDSFFVDKNNLLITEWINHELGGRVGRSCDLSYLSPKIIDLKKAIKQAVAIKVNEEATD